MGSRGVDETRAGVSSDQPHRGEEDGQQVARRGEPRVSDVSGEVRETVKRELVNDELESAKKAVASKYTCAPCKLQGGPAELDGILECERNFRTEGMMSSLWEESRKSVSSLLSDFHISSPYWELVDVKEAWSDGFDGLAALTYLPPGQPKLLVSRARSDISPMSGMCHTVRSVDLRVPASADSRLLFFVKFFRLKVVDPTPRSPVTKEGSDEGEEEQNEEDIRPSWQFWATAWFID